MGIMGRTVGSGGTGRISSWNRRNNLSKSAISTGLTKVEVDARVLRSEQVCLRPVSRNGDAERPFQDALLSDLPRDLPSLHLRHADVEQHPVRLANLDGLQSTRSVGGDCNFVAIKAQ